jgi:hypothetical protein
MTSFWRLFWRILFDLFLLGSVVGGYSYFGAKRPEEEHQAYKRRIAILVALLGIALIALVISLAT